MSCCGNERTSVVWLSHMYLEYHYDNPRLEPLIDNTGFRFWYTEQIRQYDSGIIAIGHSTINMKIPPGQASYKYESYCFGGILWERK